MGEASPGQRTSESQFAIRQLQRRPAGSGAAGLTVPFAKCSGSGFTATDGAYYGLAQITGADPSAFGCADAIEISNDPGDATEKFLLKTAGGASPGVVQVYNGTYLMGYDIGVTFTTTFTATAELWIGTGVGGGTWAYERACLINPSASADLTLRITGHVPGTFETYDPATSTSNRQLFGGILLCTGANVAVDETWCYVSVLSVLDVVVIAP
jgi:hypothetical protein